MGFDRLIEKIKATKNPSVVGLDPKLDYVPEHLIRDFLQEDGCSLKAASRAIFAFNKAIIDEICDIVPAIKPQAAYYEMYGYHGMKTLEKTIRYIGYDVLRVMNITDVGHLASDADTGEDKMLKGARREHKTVMEIAQYYTDAFFADCEKLNIKRPDIVQPATGCVGDYIRIISTLMDKGYAYFAGGNVYFDTSKLEKYYVFNDHDQEDLAVGVREGVEEDPNKRNKGCRFAARRLFKESQRAAALYFFGL